MGRKNVSYLSTCHFHTRKDCLSCCRSIQSSCSSPLEDEDRRRGGEAGLTQTCMLILPHGQKVEVINFYRTTKCSPTDYVQNNTFKDRCYCKMKHFSVQSPFKNHLVSKWIVLRSSRAPEEQLSHLNSNLLFEFWDGSVPSINPFGDGMALISHPEISLGL